MSRKKAFLPALLTLLALLLCPAAPTAGQQQYAAVRVRLTNLNIQHRLDIGIYGSYMVDNRLSFQRGSRVQAELKDGRILLYHEGACYQAGTEVRFVRHQAAGGQENGLRFQDGLNLYEGDLVLLVRDRVLVPVLHTDVETYLKGVVPYEMNDGFPPEALKAQAVAARTYTLKNINPGADYDVVDNTNDQVFKGYNADNANAVEAIRATEGLCLTYGRELAMCYYTASNGGQTASAATAWGKKDQGYLPVKDDPYDAENPESPVKSAVLVKHVDGGTAGSEAFTALVLSAMQAPLRALGCNTQAGSYSIGRIEKAEAVAPRSGAGVQATGLRLVIRPIAQQDATRKADGEVSLFAPPQPAASPVTVRYAAAALLAETVTVELPLFPEVEQALALSINSADNELVRVQEDGDAFTISFRRYGHGVGMSQRGAQWMAQKHGFSYEQIIAFYYPHTALQRFATRQALPAALSETYLSTPGPAPTATPRPTVMPLSAAPQKGEWVAVVHGISETSSLNLRAMPDTSSEVLRQLYYGQELLVTERAAGGWLKVKTDVAEGYVMEKFVVAK